MQSKAKRCSQQSREALLCTLGLLGFRPQRNGSREGFRLAPLREAAFRVERGAIGRELSRHAYKIDRFVWFPFPGIKQNELFCIIPETQRNTAPRPS